MLVVLLLLLFMWIIPIFYSSADVYVAYIKILQIFYQLNTIL